jgi:hypothetical protein
MLLVKLKFTLMASVVFAVGVNRPRVVESEGM